MGPTGCGQPSRSSAYLYLPWSHGRSLCVIAHGHTHTERRLIAILCTAATGCTSVPPDSHSGSYDRLPCLLLYGFRPRCDSGPCRVQGRGHPSDLGMSTLCPTDTCSLTPPLHSSCVTSSGSSHSRSCSLSSSSLPVCRCPISSRHSS